MNTAPLIIYSTRQSNRFEYVLQWLFTDVLGISYQVVDNEAAIQGLPFFISYGRSFTNALSIPDKGLLWKTDTDPQAVEIDMWQDIPTLYATNESGYSLPFDIFSAIFFLLARYEEYYTYKPDKHGRYPATESLLYKNGWLQRPIVDEWLLELSKMLQQKGIAVKENTFSFQPTYDIDIAYSYLNKSKKRIRGANIRDLLKGNISGIKERAQVLQGERPDPYDSFDWIIQAHQNSTPQPIYFILAALNTTEYDKNNLPDTLEMNRLIKRLAKNGSISIHPSYYSEQGDTLRREKHLMEVMIGKPITCSRQHYIRLVFPRVYRSLIANNIKDDHSMGYGSHLGFRAGTGRSFNWFDILTDSVQPLRIHPFCFMDTTALYYENLSAENAFNKLNGMTQLLKKTNSQLITVFHNFSLGTEQKWSGWKDAYASFLNTVHNK